MLKDRREATFVFGGDGLKRWFLGLFKTFSFSADDICE